METGHVKKFGGRFCGSYAHNFIATWNKNEFVLERPFNSNTVTLDKINATSLRNTLNEFLKGK